MAQRLALIIGNSVFRDQTLARLLKPDADVGVPDDELRGKLMGAELLVNLKKLALPEWLDLDFDDIRATGKTDRRSSAAGISRLRLAHRRKGIGFPLLDTFKPGDFSI